jgi:hypothetical protein
MKPPNVLTSILVTILLWLWQLLWRRAFNALAIIALTSLLTNSAHAGWFTRKPDPAMEAANRALTQAAETANETARIQGEQNIRIAEAITQLSGERAQLAGHLESLREFAARDSAWAAALSAVGPVLIVALVLAVGGVALWLVTRSGPADAQLVDVLLDEVTGDGPRWLGAGPTLPHVPLLQDDLEEQALLVAADDHHDADNAPDFIPNTTEEFPF